jgi:hypothetical protein
MENFPSQVSKEWLAKYIAKIQYGLSDVSSCVQFIQEALDAPTYQLVTVSINLPKYDEDKFRTSEQGKAQVKEYAKLKTEFPPIVLDANNEILDGMHRTEAAKLRGDKSIKAYIPVEPKLASSENFISIPLGMMRLPYTKVAMSVPELVAQTNAFSVKRRPGCTPHLLDSNPKDLFLHYNVKCQESYSDPKGHDVRVKFDVSKVDETQNANDLDVQLNCSCPAALYWGGQWNLHQRDALLGEPRPELAAPTKRLDLRNSFVLCIAPGTHIWMADGSEKLIEDVKVGDWVFTHKGRARQVTHTTHRASFLNENAVKISSQGAFEPLVVSRDHPLAVVRGNETCFCGCNRVFPSYRETRDIKWGRKYLPGHHHNRTARKPTKSQVLEIQSSLENQYVLAKRYGVSQSTIARTQAKAKVIHVDSEMENRASGKLVWIKPPDLHARESLYFPTLEWTGTKEVDLDFAALIGYYLAEGSIGYHKTGKNFQWKDKKSIVTSINGVDQNLFNVTFTLNVDERDTLAKDITERLLRLLGKDVAIRTTHQSDTDGDEWLTVTVNHPQFAADMLRLGGMGSATKQMAEEIWSWNKTAIKEVVAAYALGDGHIGKEGQQYVYSTSRLLLSQVSTILFSLGIWHGFLYQDWQGKKSLGKLKKNRYYRLYWDYRQYPQLLDLMISRLRPHVLADIESTKPRVNRSELWGDGFLRCFYTSESVSAPPIFYDLTVDEDESFIANRVVVHNCKHQKAVLERILPSVQHNIIKIIREKKVKKYKEEQSEYRKSDKLRTQQETMKKRMEIRKLRETKNKDIQKKLLDALREREEKLKKPEEPSIVERDETATKGPLVVDTPKKEDVTKEEPYGDEDLTGLLENEENRLKEEQHNKIKQEPHIHEGLPYETEEVKKEHGHSVPTDEELMEVIKEKPSDKDKHKELVDKVRKRKQTSLEAALLASIVEDR